MMVDFLSPYLQNVGKLKDSIEYLRNLQFQDRSKFEEMQHQVARFKKYDEFFAECNRKINLHEHDILQIEKKLQEEIHALETSKYNLSQKLAMFERDNQNFRDANEAHTETLRDFQRQIDKMR